MPYILAFFPLFFLFSLQPLSFRPLGPLTFFSPPRSFHPLTFPPRPIPSTLLLRLSLFSMLLSLLPLFFQLASAQNVVKSWTGVKATACVTKPHKNNTDRLDTMTWNTSTSASTPTAARGRRSGTRPSITDTRRARARARRHTRSTRSAATVSSRWI